MPNRGSLRWWAGFLAGWALVFAGCAPTHHLYYQAAGRIIDQDLERGTWRELAAVPAFDPPASGLAYERNNRYLLVRTAGGSTLGVLNAGSGALIRTQPVPVPAEDPGGRSVAVKWQGRRVWVDGGSGRWLYEFSLDSGQIRRTLDVGEGGPIAGLAFDQKRDRLWVLRAEGRILTEIEAGSGAERSRLAVPPEVDATAVGFDSWSDALLLPLTGGGLLYLSRRGETIGLARPTAHPITGIDTGPNTPVRVF